MDINIKLDIKPISVNASYSGRHFKTPACKAFEKELWYLLPERETIKGEVEMWFEFFLINYSRTDISNLIKVTEDILVKKKYIEDDRKVVSMHISKAKSEKDMMTIKIKSNIIDERSIKKRNIIND